MNKIIGKKLVKALRSKKYKKGFGLLKEERNKKIFHCPLGILCEIYNQEMKKKRKKELNCLLWLEIGLK
jgi:hypothetical protein